MVRRMMRALLGTGLLSWLAFTSGAEANNNIHASIFHSPVGKDACFTHFDNGVHRSSSSGSCAGTGLNLVAPVIYTSTTSSTRVWVEGTCGSANLTCTVESFDYNGTFLDIGTLILTGAPFDQSVTVDTSFWGFAQISCTFPAAATGSSCRILGIDVEPV